MKQKAMISHPFADLRTSAENSLKKISKEQPVSYADVDSEKMIRKMQIYQIELEMQNEELKKLRHDAEILAEKYIDIYDFSPIGYLSLDPLGFITIANLRAAKLLGTHRAMLVGKFFPDWIAEQSLTAFSNFLKEIFRTGNPATCELSLKITGQCNCIVQVKANLSPSGTECRLALMDVTERKNAENALCRSETILRNVFETNPVGLGVIKNGVFQSINEAWIKICGYTESDLTGNGLRLFNEEEKDHEQVNHELFKDLAERGFASVQTKFRHKNGNIRNVVLTAVPLFLNDDSNMALVTVEDITERKQAEEELAKEKQRLEETNHELESFSYSVSHDLQAPLRAIEGFSRMILKRQGEHFDNETARQFRVIIDNVKKMEKLIADLLAFSRLERRDISKAKFDLYTLIREVWDEYISINSGRNLTLKIEDIPPCFADRALIKQVIGNILENAIKFSILRSQAVIEAGAEIKKDEIIYYIRDNGIGFDMTYYDRLFTIFKTLHDRKEYAGTGVGLALAQRIINRHGGRIWAESNLNHGSTFYFTIPHRS